VCSKKWGKAKGKSAVIPNYCFTTGKWSFHRVVEIPRAEIFRRIKCQLSIN